MPVANENQDTTFQPKTQEYSYNANKSSFENPKPKSKNHIVDLLISIILLIIISLAAFFYLKNSGNIKTLTKQEISQNAKNLGAPSYNPDLKQTVVNAIFIKLTKDNLEVEASMGKMTFAVDSNTILQSLIANSKSNAKNGGTLDSGQTYTPDNFANQVPKGSFLQIFYVTEGKNLKAIKVYYIPNHKFN